MNLILKILAWIAIVVLGWWGLKLLLGTVFGLFAVLGTVLSFVVQAAILAVIIVAIGFLWKRVRSA